METEPFPVSIPLNSVYKMRAADANLRADQFRHTP